MIQEAYAEHGFYLIRQLLTAHEVERLRTTLAVFDGQVNNYGVRGLLQKLPELRDWAYGNRLAAVPQEILGATAKPVRAVFFDKLPEANWGVAWHQDTSIAVNRQADLPGFGPWSVKDGMTHVEPPPEYLQNLLTLRIHLDRADNDNGALRVIPGSHRQGRIKAVQILAIAAANPVHICHAEPGDVLLMSPLLLHASHKAKHPSHRRIIHIEYSAMALPEPLQWHEQH